MKRHANLSDPVVRTRDMQEREFTKYIKICEIQSGTVDPMVMDEIKNQLYSSHKCIDKEALDKIWNFMEPRLKNNAGLASFCLDHNAAKSDYFFPWLINLSKSPSEALEMAYGAGTRMDGEWVYPIPEDDPIDFFVRNDPAFVYNRERQLYVADLATTVYDNAWDRTEVSKIVDFGAGRLAWMRWHGFYSQREFLRIYAFDKDPSIDPQELFDEDLYQLGVSFKKGDFIVELTNPDCRDANLVILGGVASYIPADIFAEQIIPAAHQLLLPGGYFFFDKQIDCPCLQWSMKVFDWPDMYLPASATEAIYAVEQARKALWQKGYKFGAEYTLDTYNECPTAVMVTFQKI